MHSLPTPLTSALTASLVTITGTRVQVLADEYEAAYKANLRTLSLYLYELSVEARGGAAPKHIRSALRERARAKAIEASILPIGSAPRATCVQDAAWCARLARELT